MKSSGKNYDASLVDYYDDEVMGHADSVYRFAFAITLSLDSALKLTRQTFQAAASMLEKMKGVEGQAAVAWLFSECWRVFLDGKNSGSGDAKVPVAKALKGLALEQRAALVAVDVIGLSAAEASQVFGWTEAGLRQKLAEARRTLIATDVVI